MKKSLLLLLMLLPSLLWAQAPDQEAITAHIVDPASEFFYPNLMMRYRAGDLTLTQEEYHHLYYGFIHHENYRPLESNEAYDKVLLLASTLNPDRPEISSLEAILQALEQALDRDPFSPQLLNLQAYAFGALGNTTREAIAYEQMQQILRVIERSGDGLTKSTPCHIIMFGHALDLLTAQQLSYQKAKVISRSVEYIPLTTPREVMNKRIKGYYFDYSRIYLNKPEGYVFKRERTWQFNNLKPREYK